MSADHDQRLSDALLVPEDDWTSAAIARGMPASVAQKLPHLPESPGVYLWKDAEGTVLYVGKAKRLRSRVKSYWAQDHLSSPKTRGLMRKVRELDTIVVPSESHALILEATLIKEYHPRFNIALRDDKSYPYIKVTVQEPFPRVIVTRRLQDDGARYFGPYNHPVYFNGQVVGGIIQNGADIHTSIAPEYQKKWNPRPYINSILYPALDKYGEVTSVSQKNDKRCVNWLLKLGFVVVREEGDLFYLKLVHRKFNK